MIRVPMTLNDDEMRLIAAYNEMKRKANGQPRQMIVRVTRDNLQLFDVTPITITITSTKQIDKRLSKE